MNFSTPFILRPVATILLSLGLLVAGIVSYLYLPVAPLPNLDIPAIVIFANRPGADPATMANSVAAPLERRLADIGGIDEVDSINSTGVSTIISVFDFDRDIEGAARDVQAAINAAQADLPSDLPIRPFYRKINPTDSPIITIALSSDTLSVGQIYDAADTVLAQRLAQVEGVSRVQIQGGQTPAVRVQLDPGALRAAGISAQDVYTAIRNANVLLPTGSFQGPKRSEEILVNGQIHRAVEGQERRHPAAIGRRPRHRQREQHAPVRLERTHTGHHPGRLQNRRRQCHSNGGPRARATAATGEVDIARNPYAGAR
jgi:multidrug efflux pump